MKSLVILSSVSMQSMSVPDDRKTNGQNGHSMYAMLCNASRGKNNEHEKFDKKYNKYASYSDWRISPHADRRRHSCKRYFWQCIKYKTLLNTVFEILQSENTNHKILL